VILQPRFIPGLTARVDWYDIKLKNAINTVDLQQLAELCVDQPSLNNVFCSAIVRQSGTANGVDQPGNVVDFTLRPQNVAQFATAGLDVNFSYRKSTARLGTFALNVVGNYLDKLNFIGSPGADVTNSRGETYAPKYTVRSDLTWTKGPFTLNYGLLYFSKTLRFTNLETSTNPDITAPEYKYLKPLWQHNLYAAVDVDKKYTFYLGANNLFDQKPEIGTTRYPVSSVGRFFYAGAKVKLGKIL
jgi:outer membrane receptor protein involved in Fe transport